MTPKMSIKKRINTIHRAIHGSNIKSLIYILQSRFRHKQRLRELEIARSTGKTLYTKLFPAGKMIIWPEDIVCSEIYEGYYEFSERVLLGKLIKKNMVVIDVGANVGLFTVVFSALIGMNGIVYAFEPERVNYERLKRNIAYSRAYNAIAIKSAVSNEEGEYLLSVTDEKHKAWCSLGIPSAQTHGEVELVPALTLDGFCDEKSLTKVDLIKIDVEGWEMKVVEGAQRMLRSSDSPMLMVEFTEENARNNGTTCAHLYQELDKLGYSLYKYNYRENSLIRVSETEDFSYINLLCLKDRHIEDIRNIGVSVEPQQYIMV